MGILVSKQGAVSGNVGVCLETFQEKVDNINTAARNLKECFTEVLKPANELHDYLSSLPEKAEDDQYDSQKKQDDSKRISLSFLKKFQISVSECETKTNQSVQTFLEFAKHQMGNIYGKSTDCVNVSMLDTYDFPDHDLEEEEEASRKRLKGENHGTSLRSSKNLEELFAYFKTEANLLKEKIEMYEKFHTDEQIRAATMEECVEEMKTYRSKIENELQIERDKVINLEKLKEENEKLEKDKILIYERLLQLHNKISKQVSTQEDEKKDWSKSITNIEYAIEKYRLDLENASDRYERKKTKLKRVKEELLSKHTRITILEYQNDENVNLKQENIRLSEQMRGFESDLNKQNQRYKDDEKKWSNIIKEKEDEIRKYRKDLNDANEQSKREMTKIEHQLQLERRNNNDLNMLKKDLENLKKDNSSMCTNLRELQMELTKICSIKEEEKQDFSNRIKGIEVSLEKYRQDVTNAHEKNMEKEKELQKCREDLNNANTLYSDEMQKTEFMTKDLKKYEVKLAKAQEEFKTTKDKLLQDISDAKMALKREISEKEHILQNNEYSMGLLREKATKQELENQENVQKMNDFDKQIAHVEKRNQDLREENEHLKTTNQDMQQNIDQKQKDADRLKEKYRAKLQLLKKKNEELEKVKSEMQKAEKELTEKYENLLKKHTDMIEERDSKILLKTNLLEKLTVSHTKLETEVKQLSEDVETKDKEMQTLNLLHEQFTTFRETAQIQLGNKEAKLVQYIKENEELESKLKSESENYKKEHQSKDKIILDLKSKNASLLKSNQQAIKQYGDEVTSLKAEIERQKAEIERQKAEISKYRQDISNLNEESNQLKNTLKKTKSTEDEAKQEINDLKSRKKQLELQQKNLGEELVRLQQDNDKLKEDLKYQTDLCENQNGNLKRAQDELNAMKREIKESKQQNSRNNDTIVEIRRQADKFKMENQKLTEDYGNLLQMNEHIALELAQWKSIKTLKIQLYSSCRVDLLSGVETELMKMLKSKLENDRLKLEFVQCSKQSEIQPNIPTLLLCISASRLGVDVTHAIHGLPRFPVFISSKK